MILEIDNIELQFAGKRILYGVYLKAEVGKVTGVLGRNGSGKTSLLRIVFGDLSPKYHTIRIDGKNRKGNLFKSGSIAYLPQHQLLPNTIKLSRAFSYFSVNWDAFINIFESFSKYKSTSTSELSSGELRIVETYLVLCSDRSIILLDEPFSFIAPIYIQKFKSLIAERKKKSMIIITDHFYKEIMNVSDTVYLLKNGYSKLVKTEVDLANEGYISFNPQQK